MSLKQNRRSGINPFSYIGIDSIAPLNLIRVNRPPRTGGDPLGDDYTGFHVGDFWIDTSPVAPDPQEAWVLVKISGSIATWVKFEQIIDLTLFIEDDEFPAGRAIPDASGAIALTGSSLLRTSGSGNTVTYEFPASATLGTTLIGGSAGNVWGGFTSLDGSVLIEPDFDFINIKTNVVGIEIVQTDAGQAFPDVGDINIYGGRNIETTADNINTVTINLANSVSFDEMTLSLLGEGILQTDSTGELFSDSGDDGELLIGGGVGPLWYPLISSDASVTITNGANSINLEAVAASGGLDSLTGDTGTATPDSGTIAVVGTGNINTFGDGLSTLQVNLTDNITIAGTLTVSSLGEGVVSSDGFGTLSVSKGNDGQILIASASGTPYQWANLTSSDASVVITSGANTINLESSTGSGITQFNSDSGLTKNNLTFLEFDSSRGIVCTAATSPTYKYFYFNNHRIQANNSLTVSSLGEGVVLVENGVLSSSNGSNGQILFAGGTGTICKWGDVTSTGGTITVTPGPNSLDLSNPAYSGNPIGLGSEAFLAHQTTTILIGNVLYYLGDSEALTEIYDTGSNFYPGDGAGAHAMFTAPATGKYYLGYNQVFTGSIPIPAPPVPPVYVDPLGYMEISTSRSSCINAYLDTDFLMLTDGLWANYLSVTADLDSGDTVTFKTWIDNLDTYVYGDATELRTFVCGYKIA